MDFKPPIEHLGSSKPKGAAVPVGGENFGVLKLLNYSIVTIEPKPSFVAWINSVVKEKKVTLQEVVKEGCNSYKVPEFEYEEETLEYVFAYFETIFENELATWEEDDRKWPTSRTIDNFRQWFSIRMHDLVFDLMDKELEREIRKEFEK